MRTCRLPAAKRNPQESQVPSPPIDLASLKNFIRSGRNNFKQHRDDVRWKEINVQVVKLSKLVAKLQRDRKAPTRVILYLEGLDCSGKSSTGMLVCDALEKCGYTVDMAQHNRPPTPEQRKKAWMDRIRFEYPEDMFEEGTEVPDFASLVWDRGPAGDFVYGNLSELSQLQKLHRYKEFRAYDYTAREEGVLFLKCFFVTDKDR
jgi:polyphosphate kinase 2 (PPK2 family)